MIPAPDWLSCTVAPPLNLNPAARHSCVFTVFAELAAAKLSYARLTMLIKINLKLN